MTKNIPAPSAPLAQQSPLTAILATLFSLVSSAVALAAPSVTSNFPGGSVEVESIDKNTCTIRFLPATYPNRGLVAWWYFKVEGVKSGETVTLDLGGTHWAQPDQAHFSYNNNTWLQTAPGERTSGRIVYKHRVSEEAGARGEIWFAWGPPFLLQQARNVVSNACATTPDAHEFDLARSFEGRAVPAVLFSRQSAPDAGAQPKRPAVWVHARQHAWEAGSSWVAQGLVEWLASDAPLAMQLRKTADIYVVPIMDVDNVERGAGGKKQAPHDHNQDWGDSPHFPEVRAAIARVNALEAEGRLAGFFDLHNPSSGPKNVLYFIPAQPLLTRERRANQVLFFEICREEMNGPMAFQGRLGPSGATYDPVTERSSESWMANHSRPCLLSLTLETPWNAPDSTPAGYREIGAQLGQSIARYIADKRRIQ